MHLLLWIHRQCSSRIHSLQHFGVQRAFSSYKIDIIANQLLSMASSLKLRFCVRSDCEIQLEGEGPWRLPGDPEDVEIILTPGHTRGHIVLVYKNTENPEESACFTGDHLAFSRLGGLTIFKYAPKSISAIAL